MSCIIVGKFCCQKNSLTLKIISWWQSSALKSHHEALIFDTPWRAQYYPTVFFHKTAFFHPSSIPQVMICFQSQLLLTTRASLRLLQYINMCGFSLLLLLSCCLTLKDPYKRQVKCQDVVTKIKMLLKPFK